MQNINYIQLKKDIEEALIYFLTLYNIKDQVERINYENDTIFTEYSGYYLNTNEPLDKIFEQVDFTEKKKALTVLSSGDHELNLIFKGVLDITTFDTNRLTEYFALGYKNSALKCLEYDEFLYLFQGGDQDNYKLKLQDYIFQNMPHKYNLFWKSLTQKYYQLTGNYFFVPENAFEKKGLANNLYIQSKTHYEITRKNLMQSSLKFNLADIKRIPEEFQRYDIIELSNILNYTSAIFLGHNKIKQKIELLEKLYFNNLNQGGELFFDCIFPKDVNPSGESINEVEVYLSALRRYSLKVYNADEARVFSLARRSIN